MDTPITLRFFRGRLPHWLVADRPYFVTVCRKGSLPLALLADLQRLHEQASNATDEELPPRPSDTLDGHWGEYFKRFEAALDGTVASPRDLTTPVVAKTILNSLQWLRNRGWRVWACGVMPSHLHMVLHNGDGHSDRLTEDLGRFKNFTGREANRLLGLSGRFWQRESFDHWCRSHEHWLRFVLYTAHNPVKAGLAPTWQAWPWTVMDPEVEKILDQAETTEAAPNPSRS